MLGSLLGRHKRFAGGPVQTHTWFAASPLFNATAPLHVPDKDVSLLREALVADVHNRTDLSTGANSLSEKLSRGSSFRFVADLDFCPQALTQWIASLESDDDVMAQLVTKLQDVVNLYHSVVEQCTGAPTLMILTTRLAYKIHLHFPQVIVDAKHAKVIVKTFVERFSHEHPDLFSETVADASIYTTGLRMLYCHKGSMTNAAKLKKERLAHGKLFPTVPYCDVYYITNETTWEQKRIPCVEDLELTSLPVPSDIPLTQLTCSEQTPAAKISRLVKSKKAKHMHDEGWDQANTGLSTFLADHFSINEQDIHIADKFVKDSVTIVPTVSKTCPFVSRDHSSNHVYFVVKPDAVELRCHSIACKGKASILPIPKANGGCSTTMTVNGGKTPLSVLSDKLNETFDLPENDWTDRGLVGRKGSRFYEMAPSSTRCLHHHDFEHSVPGLCKLCFREGDVDRMLKIVCPKYGSMDVTGLHYTLLEHHSTYIGQLNITGKIDINVKKEKETILAKLIDMLYDAGESEALLRDETMYMYRPRVDPLSGEIVPCCYEVAETHKEFIHRVFSGNSDYIGDPDRHTKLEKSLRQTAHPKIPFYKTSPYYIGVKNGLIKLWPEPEFILFSDLSEHVKRTIRTRNYIDHPLDLTREETPNWDALVEYQIEDEQARRFLLAFLGRNLFPIGTDAHECMMFIYGRGKTGKSTILEAMEKMVGSENVSSFMAKGEARFGLEGKEDKALLRIGDMPANIEETLPATVFQEMMSGAMLAIARKNKIASDTRWKTPVIAAGNRFPNWENLGDCIARRLAIFVFKRSVMRGDSSVKASILNQELPMILWKSLTAYHELLYNGLAKGTRMFIDNCPPYFTRTRQLYERSADDMLNFFFNDEPSALLDDSNPNYDIQYAIDFDEDYRTEYLDLLPVFELWCKKTGRKMSKKDLGKMLPVWDNLGCTIVNRMKVFKPCPTPPCTHTGPKKDTHGQWKRDTITGLRLTSEMVSKTADVASDDDQA